MDISLLLKGPGDDDDAKDVRKEVEKNNEGTTGPIKTASLRSRRLSVGNHKVMVEEHGRRPSSLFTKYTISQDMTTGDHVRYKCRLSALENRRTCVTSVATDSALPSRDSTDEWMAIKPRKLELTKGRKRVREDSPFVPFLSPGWISAQRMGAFSMRSLRACSLRN
ncbi:hypothetical protein BU16DRAFT_559021 [Lophium mytilinum]|uniref:Uncharacterized protein n=1 Tax=Lophium mytilinum TaxID=390894 RepID=A0A6A6R4V7_9PEZI|nr:hypothetical protein BU16DRAFT_559021 [Lophium mytilinum]